LQPSATWPAIAAALQRHPQPIWLLPVGSVAQLTATAPARSVVAAWQAWTQWVRRQRKIPGLLLTDATVLLANPLAWAEAAATCGGLLVVVAQPESAAQVRQLALALATVRAPRLGLAVLAPLPCHLVAANPFDLQLLPARSHQPIWQHACQDCSQRAACPGPLEGRAVQAVAAAVSNQRDLVRLAEPSPAPSSVWLGEEQFALRTPSGEPLTLGADPELDQMIRDGQLYLDLSDQPRLTDFAGQLRLLTATPQGWVPATSPPFEAEEVRLLQRLRQLRGTVVDVGAGPIRYVQELQAAMQAGTLRYIAVEPDLAALRATREVLPQALLLQGSGEVLPLANGCADAVLFLRSVNHIPDLRLALHEAHRLLKPGGTLILVDNVGFALVRSPSQMAAAHAISTEETPFEHFRNDNAAAVAALLADTPACGWVLEVVEEVGPGTSNQWCILARRQPNTLNDKEAAAVS
jgi:SAM-dependent methyltransferase